MDKLVEREPDSRGLPAAAPALAVQFFLIPLAVVAVTVLIYAGFRTLLADDRSVEDYLEEIQHGGSKRRWPAAFELSRMMADPAVRAGHPELGPALAKAFAESKREDPLLRRYLALALGRLDPPLPASVIPSLTEAVTDPDSETRISAIWALGSLGDPSVIPALTAQYRSEDPGVRKMVVYALGALSGDTQIRTLQAALNDSVPDVRWNAAVALARHGRRDGIPVLGQMLDRAELERALPAGGYDDRAGEVIVSSLRALAMLRDSSLRERIVALSQDDRSMKVRQAALETLELLSRPEARRSGAGSPTPDA